MYKSCSILILSNKPHPSSLYLALIRLRQLGQLASRGSPRIDGRNQLTAVLMSILPQGSQVEASNGATTDERKTHTRHL